MAEMKKYLSLLMAVVAVLSTLSLSTSKAQAAGIITYAGGQFIVGKGIAFVFKASGYGKNQIRGANIFAGSNFHNLSCSVKKDEGKIVCVARGGLTEYGGETGIIYLAGQRFYVTIPYMAEGPDDESACEDPDALGAQVRFEDSDGSLFTEFVPGGTLGEIEASAAGSVTANELVGYEVVSGIDCGSASEPEEEVPEPEEPEVPEPEEPEEV